MNREVEAVILNLWLYNDRYFDSLYQTQVLVRTDWKVSGKGSATEILDFESSTLRVRMTKLNILRWRLFNLHRVEPRSYLTGG